MTRRSFFSLIPGAALAAAALPAKLLASESKPTPVDPPRDQLVDIEFISEGGELVRWKRMRLLPAGESKVLLETEQGFTSIA